MVPALSLDPAILKPLISSPSTHTLLSLLLHNREPGSDRFNLQWELYPFHLLKNKLKLFYVCGVWPTCLSVHYAQAWVLGHALVEVWSTWPKLRQLRGRKLSWRTTLSDWLVGKSEGWWWWNFLIDGWWRMSHPVWMVPALGKCSWIVQESKIASHVEWASKQYSSRVPTLVPSPDFFLWWIVTYKLKQTFSSLKLVLFSVLS